MRIVSFAVLVGYAFLTGCTSTDDALQDAADIGFGEIHFGFRSGEGLLTRPIHKIFTAFCVMHGRSFIVDHTPSLLRFAETGKLIAFLPEWRVKAQLEDGALVTIELDEPPIIHRLFMITRKGLSLSAPAQELANFLKMGLAQQA